MKDMEKMTPIDLLKNKDFQGIILSESLIKKLRLDDHPWLKIKMENDITNKGEVIEVKSGACLIHEDGWGFTSVE